MSDTKRKIVRVKKKNNPHSDFDNGFFDNFEEAVVDDTQAKFQKTRTRRMTPYAKKGERKFEPSTTYGVRESRERIRNANRSLKKTVRQQFQRELREELESLNSIESSNEMYVFTSN